MIVLSAIGRFFKKIWDWIKQTAWIQPLLIVGIIFGVIFSIPSIVKGVKAANEKKNAAEVYYLQYQVSLEGDENSAADKLTKAILNNDKSSLGFKEDKFFLMYVSETCTECANIKGAFQVLEEKLGKDDTFKSDDGNGFKLVTIFTDQNTKSTTDDESAFAQYLDRNEDFFNEAGGAVQNTHYYDADKINKTDLEYMITVDKQNFLTPTIMLVDLSVDARYESRYENGVTELMFGVPGSTDYERAELLLDCWNHTGDFDVNGK